MPTDVALKVCADHLRRDAFLYVRQSSLRQVFENTESTKRQYALRDRAVALGWPIERVHVIDSDLGLSGAQSEGRDGFQHLVTEVAMGHAGVVLGLEVSRLARNNADWHRLLELAAMTHTLILDEDGIYDPAHFNDRLLLGLKGTMSEAELHILRSRLQGGILNKARRGELEMPLPIGLVYTADARVVLDPDRQIQDTVRLLFDTSARPVPRARWCAACAANRSCSRGACGAVSAGATCCGARSTTRACCRSCTTRATPERSPTGAAAPRTTPSSNPFNCACRSPIGRC
jgi:DNA invertase Pin-like site-specific DNA recombinase